MTLDRSWAVVCGLAMVLGTTTVWAQDRTGGCQAPAKSSKCCGDKSCDGKACCPASSCSAGAKHCKTCTPCCSDSSGKSCCQASCCSDNGNCCDASSSCCTGSKCNTCCQGCKSTCTTTKCQACCSDKNCASCCEACKAACEKCAACCEACKSVCCSNGCQVSCSDAKCACCTDCKCKSCSPGANHKACCTTNNNGCCSTGKCCDSTNGCCATCCPTTKKKHAKSPKFSPIVMMPPCPFAPPMPPFSPMAFAANVPPSAACPCPAEAVKLWQMAAAEESSAERQYLIRAHIVGAGHDSKSKWFDAHLLCQEGQPGVVECPSAGVHVTVTHCDQETAHVDVGVEEVETAKSEGSGIEEFATSIHVVRDVKFGEPTKVALDKPGQKNGHHWLELTIKEAHSKSENGLACDRAELHFDPVSWESQTSCAGSCPNWFEKLGVDFNVVVPCPMGWSWDRQVAVPPPPTPPGPMELLNRFFVVSNSGTPPMPAPPSCAMSPASCPAPTATILQCVATQAKSAGSRCTLCAADKDGKCCVEVVTGGTCLSCDSLCLDMPGCGEVKCAACDHQIEVSGPCFHATAQRVVRTGHDDHLTLEGDVRLTYHKDHERARITADHVTIGMTDGHLEIHPQHKPAH